MFITTRRLSAFWGKTGIATHARQKNPNIPNSSAAVREIPIRLNSTIFNHTIYWLRIEAAITPRPLLQGGLMKIGHVATAVTAVVMTTFVLTWVTPAAARCTQMLAPNKWQYITVCNNTGGGGGGTDYSGAIGAGIGLGLFAIEALPGIVNSVGSIANGVTSAGTGMLNDAGNIAGGVMQSGTDATRQLGDTGAVSNNLFDLFAPQRDVPCTASDRKRGCRNIKGNAADFSRNNSGDEQYVVDPGGCSANRAVRGGCPKMEPRITCNERGCYTEYVRVPRPPVKKLKKTAGN